MKIHQITEAETVPGQSLPKQIKVAKMPTPPPAPTGPDGTGEDGTRIGTTPKAIEVLKTEQEHIFLHQQVS